MTYTCPDCGNIVPQDSDFCHRCGKMVGPDVLRDEHRGDIATESVCSRCGREFPPNEMFCKNCGNLNKPSMNIVRPKISPRGKMGVLLAAIPGMLGIFGLGHLFLKRRMRAAVFFLISFLLYYLWYTNEFNGLWTIIFFISAIFMYLMQLAEAFALAMISSGNGE